VRIRGGLPPQLFVGEEPRPDRLQPVMNRLTSRLYPEGGLWTSTLIPGTTESAWSRHADHEDIPPFVGADRWILVPNEPARVVDIVTYGDVTRLYDEFGLSPGRYLTAREKAMAASMGVGILRQRTLLLDVVKLSASVDALHVTQEAIDRLYEVMKDPRKQASHAYFDFLGWGVESTLWFRWAFLPPHAVWHRRQT
jgi:hypothetical protein